MLTESESVTIRAVYEAMQAGSEGENQMVDLFTDDGVLIEPFSGAPQEHRGQAAIRNCYRAMMAAPRPPDFKLELDRIDSEAGRIDAEWTCTASVMPAPLKGRDTYVLRGDKIERLEISLVGLPS